MVEKVFGALRCAVLVEVSRGTNNDEAKRLTEANADHVALYVLTQANAGVVALADNVHPSIFEDDFHLDARVALAKRRQDRQDHELIS